MLHLKGSIMCVCVSVGCLHVSVRVCVCVNKLDSANRCLFLYFFFSFSFFLHFHSSLICFVFFFHSCNVFKADMLLLVALGACFAFLYNLLAVFNISTVIVIINCRVVPSCISFVVCNCC